MLKAIQVFIDSNKKHSIRHGVYDVYIVQFRKVDTFTQSIELWVGSIANLGEYGPGTLATHYIKDSSEYVLFENTKLLSLKMISSLGLSILDSASETRILKKLLNPNKGFILRCVQNEAILYCSCKGYGTQHHPYREFPGNFIYKREYKGNK